MSDKISGSMQENILTLLAWDDDSANIIKNSVDIGLFESVIFRDIASQCMQYHDIFEKAPKEHLPDLLEDILEGDDAKKASLYDKVLQNIYELHDSINTEYVLSTLTKFVRLQRLKIGITESAKKIKAGDVEGAEVDITEALKNKLTAFNPGLFFTDDLMRALDEVHEDECRILLGMGYFDKIRIGPAPKELMLVVAGPNKGKSWALLHCAKMAALQRKKVLVVTLEMSESKYLSRMAQSMFSLSRRDALLPTTELIISSANGSFQEFDFSAVRRPVIGDKGVRELIEAKMAKVGRAFKLIVKQFPTSQLTISGLKLYLDQLERAHNFIPDVLIVDYADLFMLDPSNIRIATGNVIKELRGMAVDRNIAVVTASQTNRSGEDSQLSTLKHLAEDFSKAFTADIIVTHNQTDLEKQFGLARWHCAKNRDEEAGRTLLIAQQYAMGQFYLSGTLMPINYFDELNRLSEDRDMLND